MNKLEQKFEQAIKDANFNFFEITGFKSQPKLAILAGMSIGYKIALDEISKKIKGEE